MLLILLIIVLLLALGGGGWGYRRYGYASWSPGAILLLILLVLLVKPNGLFGRAYMAAIKPFRHLIVYPGLMRTIERGWRRR
jgi:hypothetical protein